MPVADFLPQMSVKLRVYTQCNDFRLYTICICQPNFETLKLSENIFLAIIWLAVIILINWCSPLSYTPLYLYTRYIKFCSFG